MKKLNTLLAACIVLFGLSFVYIPPDSAFIMRSVGVTGLCGLLLIPAGIYWFNFLNKE